MQSINFPSMKLFTLDGARRLLPQVRMLVERLMKAKQALDVVRSLEIESEGDVSDELNVTEMNKEFHRLSYQFFHYLGELEKIGCVVKDVDQGLVDFYSIVDGKELFFCWKFGENELSHWHDVESGFGGRMQISLLDKRVKSIDER